MNLQQQMLKNNEDLKNFMKDLDSWESDIKRRDEELKSKKTVKESVLPPVRNSLDKKKKKKMKKKDGGEGKQKRISSYDYRAWDKFDVEKACEDGSSDEYETDEEWEVERKKQAAILEKDKGNDYFKRGDYDNAIECYTKGADLDPTNPLLPANRAMALLKQEKFGAAEIDCTMALSLDPLYTKAYLRRGTARMGLKKYSAAKEDYERVLSLEPQNKKAKSDLDIIEKELSKENLVTHTDTETSQETGVVKAIYKPPEQRSKKPLKRIEIEEVGLEDDLERKSGIAKVEQGQGQVKKALMEKDNQMFEKFTAKSPADIGKLHTQSQSSQVNPSEEHLNQHTVLSNGVDEHQNTRPTNPKPKICDNIEQVHLDVNLDLRALNNDSANSSDKKLETNTTLESSTKRNIVKTKVPSPRSHGDISPREKPVPTTSFQFQADYKSMRHNSEAFYQYLKKISPLDYTKLFGEFLDAELLLKVLHIFKEFYIQNNEDVYESLKCLTAVKRFSMTVMFFSNKEKQVIKDLIHHLRRSGQHSDSDINSLATKYELR